MFLSELEERPGDPNIDIMRYWVLPGAPHQDKDHMQAWVIQNHKWIDVFPDGGMAFIRCYDMFAVVAELSKLTLEVTDGAT